MGSIRRMAAIGAAAAGMLGLAAIPVASATPTARTSGSGNTASCVLGNGSGRIKHVIYLQFDNVHLRRDNPNVPSDLEQMPHLLNFLKGNGTVLNKQYTILISHTAGGILSSLTGLYPDRQGVTVSNSYDYYNRQTGIPSFTSGFKYWTAPVASPVDTLPNMVNGDSGQPKTTPAPWVTYTRAGCDVGNASVANTVLENNNAVLTSTNTTLAAAAARGAVNIKVAKVTGYSAGQTIEVENEFVGVASVGTAGATGTGLTLTSPLAQSHAVGAQVVAVDPTGDMTTIFGAGSPQWNEGKASQLAPSGSAARTLAQTDFVGLAVHCAKTASSVCANNSGATADPLPDESGGYTGYKALFGAKSVNPALTGGSAGVNDINGTEITDGFGQPGFPGFDAMPAATTLGYVAQMQEAGIPVTFAYISDVHDNHAGGGAYGPGESGYVAALKSYDDAFGKFFARLAADGINKSNTLFVVTADENDHFAGQQAQNCDGVTTPCVYNTALGDVVPPATTPQHGIFDVTNGATATSDSSTWNGPTTWPPTTQNGPLVGEVGYNMNWLLGSTINNSGYSISFDSAPSFYINGQPQAEDSNGNVVVNPTLRAFEQKAANLKAFDPYIDATQLTPVARYLVDEPTLKALHMINADPQRNMSFTMFSQPDFFFQQGTPCPKGQGCVNDGFAWIHGDYSNDIGQTWLGVVGPGVNDGGIDNRTWTDHTDIVPTMDALTGLHPDYTPDGRAITQILHRRVGQGDGSESSQLLGDVYKQLDAPYGAFNHWLIVASTNGIKSDDTTYVATEQAIQSLAAQRDALALQIRGVLYGTAHGHGQQLIRQAFELFGRAFALSRR
jgi:hypothetical protein